MENGMPKAIDTVRSQYGETLREMSTRQPVLVIFLRHYG